MSRKVEVELETLLNAISFLLADGHRATAECLVDDMLESFGIGLTVEPSVSDIVES